MAEQSKSNPLSSEFASKELEILEFWKKNQVFFKTHREKPK